MGNRQSNESIKKSVTDIINRNIYNSFTKNVNEQNQTCSGRQDIEFINGEKGEIVNCDTILIQTLGLDCKAQAYFKSQNENKLTSQIKNSLDQSFTSDQKNENPSFTLVPWSDQSSADTMEIQNYIKNVVERNLTTENLNKCLSIAQGAQKGKFVNQGKIDCSEKGSVGITQEMIVKQYAQCSSDIVNKAIVTDSFINDVVTKAATTQSNVTSGYGAIIGIIVIAIIIFIIIFFLFKRSPAAQTSAIMSSSLSDIDKVSLYQQLMNTSQFVPKNVNTSVLGGLFKKSSVPVTTSSV